MHNALAESDHVRRSRKEVVVFRAALGKSRLPLHALVCHELLRLRAKAGRGETGVSMLPNSLFDALSELFHELEADAGMVLVRRALGYLTCAVDGLSESEMLDILSLDDEVVEAVLAGCEGSSNDRGSSSNEKGGSSNDKEGSSNDGGGSSNDGGGSSNDGRVLPPVSSAVALAWYGVGGVLRVPAVRWTRVRLGLGRLLVEQRVGNVVLMRWRHPELAEVARARFLMHKTSETERRDSTSGGRSSIPASDLSSKRGSGGGGGGVGSHNVGEFDNVTANLCGLLAEYFEGRWAGKPKPFAAAKSGAETAGKGDGDGGGVALDRLAPAQPIILQGEAAAGVSLTATQRLQVGINTRKLRELPKHMIAGGRAADLVNNHLTTAEWVTAKSRVLGIYELLGDFDAAQRGGYNADHLSFRFIKNAVLKAYESVVKNQTGTICSQMAPRLMQFVDNPQFPACTRLADSCIYHWPGSLAQTVLEQGTCIQPNKGWACLQGAGNAEESTLDAGEPLHDTGEILSTICH